MLVRSSSHPAGSAGDHNLKMMGFWYFKYIENRVFCIAEFIFEVISSVIFTHIDLQGVEACNIWSIICYVHLCNHLFCGENSDILVWCLFLPSFVGYKQFPLFDRFRCRVELSKIESDLSCPFCCRISADRNSEFVRIREQWKCPKTN